MTSWIVDALSTDSLNRAKLEASRRLLNDTWGLDIEQFDTENIDFLATALELAVITMIEDDNRTKEFRDICSDAFHIMRVIPFPDDPIEVGKMKLRIGCIGILADRNLDASRFLKETNWPNLPINSKDWGIRTFATILDIWLRLIRKNGWSDLDKVQERVIALRDSQQKFEADYLESKHLYARNATWELVVYYHLARAAELLALYTTQGKVDGHFDIRQQVEVQTDAALTACARAELMELDALTRLLAGTAKQLIDNSIWTITRAVNSRVTKFVDYLVNKSKKPIFEVLPPQRHTLREKGLLGSSHRAVVVSLPTSSGKTFIAEFRILQALNQFDYEAGWVAYLAPTRTLVNQICTRLRRDFSELEINVERVSPALEVDTLEAEMLEDNNKTTFFRILVTTPEKLDLMLRSGWEEKIGRPLTLVVVDEAHNLGQKERGIKLELLLATINRDCQNSQFLLLTPFINNASEVARWLSPDSHNDISLEIDWQPNDRVIALSQPQKAEGRGKFSIQLETLHTTKKTIVLPEILELKEDNTLGLTWSKVKNNSSSLAAITAQKLKERGEIIILTLRPDWAWSLARKFIIPENKRAKLSREVKIVQNFLDDEFGNDFELKKMLEYGVGVHHSGLSDDVRKLMEWLFENEYIDLLIATTTIAQGVNFPVSGIVMAQNKYYDKKEGQVPMPPEDFWNIAGRVGRVDQDSVGIVALCAINNEKAKELRGFVNQQIFSLNSTLIEMVETAIEKWGYLELHHLYNEPEWSTFLQYLAHTYRQIGNPDYFASQVEQVLRGTFGFETLRRKNPEYARELIRSVRAYGEIISGKNLKLVDSTGFSWESIALTFSKLSEKELPRDLGTWNPETLFQGDVRNLRKMMGILLEVPELRDNLTAVLGGNRKDGVSLALIIRDWVNGVSLPNIAKTYFSFEPGESIEATSAALSDCCKNIYGKIIQTVSWGLSALQTLTISDDLENIPASEQQSIRNLPAMVYYGVNSDEAIALRLLGVPRSAAPLLASSIGEKARYIPLTELRTNLMETAAWEKALGHKGRNYFEVWKILEGYN